MLRTMLDALTSVARRRSRPEHALHDLAQLLRRPMKFDELSVNPRGLWSLTQARRVQDIINPEARAHGLVFMRVDATTHNDSCSRVLLIPYCADHMIAIAEDSVCGMCLRGRR